jgi:hypothetical protein
MLFSVLLKGIFQQPSINQQPAKMPLVFHTKEITPWEFKEKHGGWAISTWNSNLSSFEVLTNKYNKVIKVNYPHLSVKMVHREGEFISFILYGASQLDFERMTTRTHEPIGTFPNGFKLYNFFAVKGFRLIPLDEKLSPPPYTEQPEQPEPIEAAWNEIEEARKQLEEERKALENEKIKMKMQAKMMLFDEEVAKFKMQFFTQDELVCIRKMIDERF